MERGEELIAGENDHGSITDESHLYLDPKYVCHELCSIVDSVVATFEEGNHNLIEVESLSFNSGECC